MPDLTVHAFACCQSAIRWSKEIKGSNGRTHIVQYGRHYNPKSVYEFDYTCTCESFKYSGFNCKHIRAAINEHCKWDSFIDSEKQTDPDKCPRCGGPVTAQNWAV